MLAALPRRLAWLGLILPVALGACRSDDLTEATPAPPAPSWLTGTVLTVTNTNDAGAGSLRQAIADAADGDAIQFSPGIAGQTILLTSGVLVVLRQISIEGPPDKGITISGADVSQVFSIDLTGGLTLTNATITRGYTTALGAAIETGGTLVLDHVTLSGNRAEGGTGGAIFNFGTLVVRNSTISGNEAEAGSALYTFAGTTTLVNTTVTGNLATHSAAILGPAIIRNSIVANVPGSLLNCYSTTDPYILDGVNLSDDASCGAAGTAMIVADAKLGPLADNGGPTKTHNLLADSPAIDGATEGCPVTDDQRYLPRPKGGACDIGAVEFNDYVTLALTVDASVSVNPKTGVAVVTGTLTCSAAVTVLLEVKLSQTQKTRRATTTVEASGVTTVDCSGKRVWSVAMAPPSGGFVNSDGSVTAQSASTQKSVTPASRTVPVKLYWGHK